MFVRYAIGVFVVTKHPVRKLFLVEEVNMKAQFEFQNNYSNRNRCFNRHRSRVSSYTLLG